MRIGSILAACTLIGCWHVSTSDYGVAAGFAAAAGALQVAEAAHKVSNSCGCHRALLLHAGQTPCV